MTAKQFVLSQYPKAKAERLKIHSYRTYWIIRNNRATMYMAEGKTEKEAWKNAKNLIIKKQQESLQ